MTEVSQLEISSTAASEVGDANPSTEDDEIVTGPEVDRWLRITPTTRWRWTKLGRLPKPFRLHPHGQNLYRKCEIRALVDAAPAVEIYRDSGDLPNGK